MVEKKQSAGGEASAAGDVVNTRLSAEDIARAEAEFPYINIASPTGQWVAEQLMSGAKKVDILKTLDSGKVPGFQEGNN